VHFNNSQVEALAVVDAIARADGDAILVRGDRTERGEAKRDATDAVEELGGPDIIVNNAGALVRRSPVSMMS
jgi:3-oxoacyl-[acyl-carrier protein] reductase